LVNLNFGRPRQLAPAPWAIAQAPTFGVPSYYGPPAAVSYGCNGARFNGEYSLPRAPIIVEGSGYGSSAYPPGVSVSASASSPAPQLGNGADMAYFAQALERIEQRLLILESRR
jgi:hypothetical protein